jgi:cellulose synthase/poly-beta-1,6-N-acetylglucosamine synthase-like glycosyltransferase
MSESPKHINVCICTYKRPNLLKGLLEELDKQQTEGSFTYSIIVADNDREQSAKRVVSDFAAQSPISTTYCVEPVQNIALARNKALEIAEGDLIAFIDDDEFPVKNWLCNLFKTCNTYGADGILGPVLPYFDQEPPEWIRKGRFFERAMHETGYRIGISDARTGNVMFRRKILQGIEEVFGAEFRTGGEDVDFFRRMMDKGCVFIWCNEAVVYEAVPPGRCKRSYLLKRSLLRGRNSLRQRAGRVSKLTRSLIAIPVYGLALPFLFVAGDHYFMRYLIKSCDHAGRLLAFLGFSPVTERDF